MSWPLSNDCWRWGFATCSLITGSEWVHLFHRKEDLWGIWSRGLKALSLQLHAVPFCLSLREIYFHAWASPLMLYLSPSLRRKMDLYSHPGKCNSHRKDIFALPSSLREVQIKIYASFFASLWERESWNIGPLKVYLSALWLVIHRQLKNSRCNQSCKVPPYVESFLCSLPFYMKSRDNSQLLQILLYKFLSNSTRMWEHVSLFSLLLAFV